MPPAADGNIDVRMGVEMGDKRRHVAQRHAEVRIHEKNNFARGAQHAGAHREPFAPVDIVFHQRDQRLSRRGLAGDCRRPVAAGLDDKDDLAQPGKIPRQRAQGSHSGTDASLLGVGRDNN